MVSHCYFSTDYTGAREKFKAACTLADISPRSYENPAPGPGGLLLTTEVARFGPVDARKLLILISGVHGIEGLAGSGCQTAFIAQGLCGDLPEGVAVLVVHAINCYGVAHTQYTTEGNVDLNQNFLDFDVELPANPAYEDIHDALCCPELQGPKRDAADAFLDEYRKTNGEPAFLKALWYGQHTHPDGLSFIGTEPTWSHRTTLEILAEFAADAEHICLIDTHSGAGKYGCGTIFTTAESGDAALGRARSWFGPSLQSPWALTEKEFESNTPFPKPAGYLQTGFVRALPHAEVVGVGLELGTFSQEQVMEVWLANHWLTFHGDPTSELGRKIKHRVLAGFYPGTEDWTDMIYPRWKQIVRQALYGLGSL